MHFSYKPQGVCSTKIDFDIENGKVYNVVYQGGCNGNLQAISRLVEGMDADKLSETLNGVQCGFKTTSCSDKLAQAVAAALESAN